MVIGQDGKPSALTIDELKAEFTSNPAFAPVIAGSKATGGGASGYQWSWRCAVKTVSRAQFNQMDLHAQKQHVLNGGKVSPLIEVTRNDYQHPDEPDSPTCTPRLTWFPASWSA